MLRLALEHGPEATLRCGALEHQLKATKLGAVRSIATSAIGSPAAGL